MKSEEVIRSIKKFLNDEHAKVFIDERINRVEVHTYKEVDLTQLSAIKDYLMADKCEISSYTYDGAITGADSWLVIIFKGGIYEPP